MKAIIFDFDGTLANTLPICYYSFQSVFKEFDDKNLSPEDIRAMFGPSETGIIRENLVHPNKEQAIELYYEKYLEKHLLLVEPNNEMDELLRSIKENGHKLGIVTGKARRSLEISLKALQMDGLFDVIITGDDVINPKPHPEGIIKALSLLDVNKEDAMFVGDSEADIAAGVSAGLLTIGVQWLEDYQTADFITQPNRIIKEIKHFNHILNEFTIQSRL
ncbi:HAD family hydrolase [Psychrobacillus sp. NEAU-3TGS]|uniref:HAD family hydrolase n=1 Tax=Psychrobacillus sp. NEAU-3TGS TaxID=2995412 RepID=UPI002499852C|nr:HAD family hydrolase [Psychrobacillus sp. NEAU-3TGS]MDI2588940.1 HAD family hydrolase [Psychrobacillus sp. NEAU-3TGS]